MSNTFPQRHNGEFLTYALRWINQHPQPNIKIIEAACHRYDLSPLDEEFLLRHCLGISKQDKSKTESLTNYS